jgi:hypothetical protein
MSVHDIKFVLVNDTAPRKPSVCAARSRHYNAATCTNFQHQGATAGSNAVPDGWR